MKTRSPEHTIRKNIKFLSLFQILYLVLRLFFRKYPTLFDSISLLLFLILRQRISGILSTLLTSRGNRYRIFQVIAGLVWLTLYFLIWHYCPDFIRWRILYVLEFLWLLTLVDVLTSKQILKQNPET